MLRIREAQVDMIIMECTATKYVPFKRKSIPLMKVSIYISIEWYGVPALRLNIVNSKCE